MDVSGSIDGHEFSLQKDGLADALESAPVRRAIASGYHGQIEMAVVQWSSSADVAMAWTVVDEKTALMFAKAVRGMARQSSGSTGVGRAIDFSTAYFAAAQCGSERQVIDMSGDGADNINTNPGAARDRAEAQRITINGLPILSDEPNLADYYNANVIGGLGAFMIPARDSADFGRAMLAKLQREIAGSLTLRADAR